MKALATLLVVLVAWLAVPAQSQAQSTGTPPAVERIDPGKLLVPRKNADGTRVVPSFWSSPGRWILVKQQDFYKSMTAAVMKIRNDGIWAAAWSLLGLSFAYGVLHAAGPGHGKTVVSAWLLATESELRRGILIAFVSSIIQALTAVVLVGSLLLLVSAAAASARQIAGVLESASYLMIAGLGLYLIWTAFRMLPVRLRSQQPALAAVSNMDGPDFTAFQPLANPHSHAHLAPGAVCADCGHAHVPAATELKGDFGLRKLLGMSFAIGIRPCTGALIVLLAAYQLGLFWVGALASLVMAFGTFLTVSAIAALSVYSRQLAMRLASRNDRWLTALGLTLRFAGGLVIAFLGITLFSGSLGKTGGFI